MASLADRIGTSLDRAELDQSDREILARRQARLDEVGGPRVGDWVRFADGVERRISFVTPIEWLPDVDCIQTSADGGGYFLGEGFVSFSGSLFDGVRRSTLTLAMHNRPGRVWFFHHDHWQAHNGVEAEALFRVYDCTQESTR